MPTCVDCGTYEVYPEKIINFRCSICRKKMKEIKKIPVASFDFDLITRETTKKHDSFIWEDEELDCEHFHNYSGDGTINCCKGNEPYSCHRSKKEGLCHKLGDKAK